MIRADPRPAPVLVLGIGNLLLADDGVGLRLLHLVRDDFQDDPRLAFVDGGTQGLALLGLLYQRAVLILLDCVQRGARPGALHVVLDPQDAPIRRGIGGHGGNASELLAAARLTGVLPRRVVLVGIEPACIETRIGLSGPVERSLRGARAVARTVIRDLRIRAVRKEPLCTS